MKLAPMRQLLSDRIDNLRLSVMTRNDLTEVAAEVRTLESEAASLRAALIRAHCDLRWFAGATENESIALRENELAGFTREWEQVHVVRGASGPGSG